MPSCNESLISEALLVFKLKKNIDSNKYFNNVMSDMIENFVYKKISIYNRFEIKFYK